MPPRALIAGLGLIGGSIGLALRARGWNVTYLDPAVERDEAIRCGAADERARGIEDCDLVVLATPVDAALDLLRTIPPATRATSVCSVMKPLREAAGERPFVAGHPLAGSHERTLSAARADLFRGRRWFIDRSDPLVETMIADCGAFADLVSPEEHDRAVALTSHLPQILSTALAASIGDDDLRFAGSGLRTFLRLAGSDAAVWRPVISANRENIEKGANAVADLVRRMLEDDPDPIFERARTVWARLEEN
ncbi:MAG TPA: prephenate dehydrogenase/arogenate dehydrogenase family protein [Thermoanaerobaculia bacterium]|nr:prephenate dehydrogenase/arogenate dehydrogenase family protein [Thermoanaerobaculia bacterium]